MSEITQVSDETIANADKALQEMVKQGDIHGKPSIHRNSNSGKPSASGYGMNVIAFMEIRRIAQEFGLGKIDIFDALD